MNTSESSRHADIHEGGYGSPMPEEEMPEPARDDAAGQDAPADAIETEHSAQEDA